MHFFLIFFSPLFLVYCFVLVISIYCLRNKQIHDEDKEMKTRGMQGRQLEIMQDRTEIPEAIGEGLPP